MKNKSALKSHKNALYVTVDLDKIRRKSISSGNIDTKKHDRYKEFDMARSSAKKQCARCSRCGGCGKY